MNLHTPSVLAASAHVQHCATSDRIWVYVGAAMLSMTREEARALAQQLVDAAGPGDALVSIPGVLKGNADLVPATHATLGEPA